MSRAFFVVVILLWGCSRKSGSREEPVSLPARQVGAAKPLPALVTSLPALITEKMTPRDLRKSLIPFLLQATPVRVAAIRSALSSRLMKRKKEALEVALGLWLRPTSTREEELPDPLFVDVSGDGMPDLIALPEIFFGPSPGYTLIVREKGRYVLRWGGAGSFTMVAVKGEQVMLAYTLDTIDEKEARVHHLVSLKRGVPGVSHAVTLFLARQTKLPALSGPTKWSFSQDISLFAAPAAAPPSKGSSGEGSALLKGGIVARYKSGAVGYRFARTGGYEFGCITSTSLLAKSALRHGMERASFDEKSGGVIYGGGIPWICGWAEKK